MEIRSCCNCGKRVKPTSKEAECVCSYDKKPIKYPACYEDWCRHWSKEKVK